MDSYSPKVLGFLCQWCSYNGADLAGAMRLQYPPEIGSSWCPKPAGLTFFTCSRPLRWERTRSSCWAVTPGTVIT